MPAHTAHPTGEARDSLETRALRQMHANLNRGWDPRYRIRYCYVRPSPGRYNSQWFWDSCFHAVTNAKLDPELAKAELLTLLATQEEDGFVGHMNYWGRRGPLDAALSVQTGFGQWRARHSAMIQPPVLAQAIEAVWEATQDKLFLDLVTPKAQRFYDWILRQRDPEGLGLAAIVSPYEAGLDNSPAFDESLGLSNPGRRALLWATKKLDFANLILGRNFDSATLLRQDRFVFYDLLVNSALADGFRTLGRLHALLGERGESRRATSAAETVEGAINERCWDAERGVYVQLASRRMRPDSCLSIAVLYPALLDGTPEQRRTEVIERHLMNADEFWTDYPVPSVARSEPTFDPSGERAIWRGPLSMGTNWLLVRGLRRHGFRELADHIAQRSRQAAELSGFREFYNPLTGDGLRGERFGWGTVAAVM